MGVYTASHRHARISARKVRPLADLIRGKFADEALEILRYQPNRGARMLEKVVQSAMGSAQNPDHPLNKGKAVRVSNLVVSSVYVNGGPMFKRIRPRARGMAFGILRRSAHIHVSLQELELG